MIKNVHVFADCTFLTTALKELFSERGLTISVDNLSPNEYSNGGYVIISLYGTNTPFQRILALDKYRYFSCNPKWNVMIIVDTNKSNEIQLAQLMGGNMISVNLKINEFKKQCLDWFFGLKRPPVIRSVLSGTLAHLTQKEWSAMTCLVRGESFASLSLESSIVSKTIYNQRFIGLSKIGINSSRHWHELLV